jgi:Ni/Co efflux regulator RcnB
MNNLMAIGLGCLALGLAGAAQAQTTTTQQTMPNGNTRTTTHVDTPDGSASTRTIDRADGTRTVVRRQVDVNGNVRSVRHDRGSDTVRVCHTRWRHGQRVPQSHDRPRRS